MEDQLKRYETYVRLVRRLLLVCGIWPVAIKRRVIRILYYQVAVVTLLCCIGISYGLQHFCREHINNFGMLTKSLSLLVSTSLIILKVIFFLTYRRQLREMMSILRVLVDDILKEPHYWPIVFSYFDPFYYSAYIIFYTVFCLCMTYSITPHVLILYQYLKDMPRRCVFPYPTSFPWPMENCGTVYKVLTFLETVTSGVFITTTSGVDTYFGYCMFQMSAVLRTMAYDIEHSTADNCEQVMRRCVERHNQLLHCRNIIQKTFSAIVLYMTATNALIMCAVIFQAYQTKLTIVGGTLFISYILLKLSQAFSYAWYGSVITAESAAFQQAVYFSDWHLFNNKSFMSGVVIILSQKPMTISAYNFFPISMELFIGILNATMSYFFLLKTLEEAMDTSISVGN